MVGGHGRGQRLAFGIHGFDQVSAVLQNRIRAAACIQYKGQAARALKSPDSPP